MKLANFTFEIPFQWKGNNICSLVLENPTMYRKSMLELLSQVEGQTGSFVLSKEGEVLDFGKNVDVISDVFTADPALNRRILSGLQKEAGEIVSHDMQTEAMEIYTLVNQTIAELIFQTGLDLAFQELTEITGILKLVNLRPDTYELTLPERLLLYMEMSTRFLKKQLFVIANLRACMEQEELERFFRDILYRGYLVLTVESQGFTSFDFEDVKIIDADLCEI